MVRKKRNRSSEPLEVPIDLASRIGMPGAPEPVEPVATAHAAPRRHDGPIEAARGRPLMIGANEPLPAPIPARQPEVRHATVGRPAFIGLEEAPVEAVAPAVALAPVVVEAPADTRAMEYAPLVATIREAPIPGEMDLVVTPLATPDDWHHFELALRRLPGVGPLRTEYYRAGILKLRVRWSGAERFAQALAKVPGYRVGILGEDRSTVQIRVGRA